MDCKRGGLVAARHNESRDLNIDLLHLTGLSQEPNSDGNGGLQVDWGVRGFWEFQKQALFDICTLNADALSYLTTPSNHSLIKLVIERRINTARQLK